MRACVSLYVCHLPIWCVWCIVPQNEKVSVCLCVGSVGRQQVFRGFQTVCVPAMLHPIWWQEKLRIRGCMTSLTPLLPPHTHTHTHTDTYTHVTASDTITILSSCPCGHMVGAFGSVIEPFSVHQFPQRTFLFSQSSERWKLAHFNWACIKSNRICLAEIDLVTRQGYRWITHLLVTHMHQLEWEGENDKDDRKTHTWRKRGRAVGTLPWMQ